MHILRESGDDEARPQRSLLCNEGGEAPTATVASPPGKTAGKKPASFSSRLLISLGVVLSPLFIFFIVSRRTDYAGKQEIPFFNAPHPLPRRLYILSMLM
jgi:hypothetical protein